MTRYKNYQWSMSDKGTTSAIGTVYQDNTIIMSVLLDIRDELQTLNAILNCPNFLAIPGFLQLISKNTKIAQVKKAKQKSGRRAK